MIRKIAKVIATASVAATTMAGMATPASANDECAGVYEVDGCEYCSYRNGFASQPAHHCDNGHTDYDWSGCGFWIAGNCIEGTLP